MHQKLFLYLLVLTAIILGFGIFAPEVLALEKVYYIHSDHLGSVTLTTDESGNVASYQTYYPYGSTRGLTENQQQVTEHQYTGQISDADQTGLYYYNARYYNPLIAKFTQADINQGPNRYLYVENNPLKHIDSSGFESEDTWKNWWIPSCGCGGSESNSSSGQPLSVDNVSFHYRSPLPNPYGLIDVNNLTRASFAIPVVGSLVGSIWIAEGGDVGDFTSKSIENPEFINWQNKVYSGTNFQAGTDLEFIESLTMSMNRNTGFNEDMLSAYASATSQGRDPSMSEKFGLAMNDFFKGDLAARFSGGKGVCRHFAAMENYLLGQQGISSEVVYSRQMEHTFLRTNLNGVSYIIDPTRGIVMTQDEYSTMFGVTDYYSQGSLYQLDLEDDMAGKSFWDLFLMAIGLQETGG